MRAFDIVTVPDFSGSASALFEARTLLFLAAWIEYGGAVRGYPMHLACIGAPPASVQWLAAKSGAHITVHAPVRAEGRGSSNKLRGLEVQGLEARVLLLDTDVLILSDLARLSAVPDGIAAAPAMKPRVPPAFWARIYPALGMPIPTARMASVAGALQCGLRGTRVYRGQERDARSMFPYYNSGVIFMRWDVGLRPLWESHVRTIAGLFSPDEEAWPSVGKSDQAGLATAIESLRRRGVTVSDLPQQSHAHWLSVYRNTPPLDDVELFHAIFLFGKTTSVSMQLGRQLHRYRLHLAHRMIEEWWLDQIPASRLSLMFRYLLPSLGRSHRLGARLAHLYRAHVAPAIQQCSRT